MVDMTLRGDAQEKGFARTLDYALGQSDFDLTECQRYMNLAFKRDNGNSYMRLMHQLDKWGFLGVEATETLALNAFLGLRLDILRSIAVLCPEVVSNMHRDGVDICRGGLVLAIAKGNQIAIDALSSAMNMGADRDERLKKTCAEALDLVSAPTDTSWGGMSQGERDEQLKTVRAVSARCERLLLEACVVNAKTRVVRFL